MKEIAVGSDYIRDLNAYDECACVEENEEVREINQTRRCVPRHFQLVVATAAASSGNGAVSPGMQTINDGTPKCS